MAAAYCSVSSHEQPASQGFRDFRAVCQAQPRNMEPHLCEGWSWMSWTKIPEPTFHPLALLLKSPFRPTALEQQ